MKNFTCFLFALLFLSACSTVINDSFQKVTVLTPGAENSSCDLSRDGLLYKVRPPQTITLKNSEEAMTVTCRASGNRVQTLLIEPKLAKEVVYNATTGFVPGFITDYHTGAMFKFPETIIVDFESVPVMAETLPDYQRTPLPEIGLDGIESLGPTRPALSADAIAQQRLDEAFSARKEQEAFERERETRKLKYDFGGKGVESEEAVMPLPDENSGSVEVNRQLLPQPIFPSMTSF